MKPEFEFILREWWLPEIPRRICRIFQNSCKCSQSPKIDFDILGVKLQVQLRLTAKLYYILSLVSSAKLTTIGIFVHPVYCEMAENCVLEMKSWNRKWSITSSASITASTAVTSAVAYAAQPIRLSQHSNSCQICILKMGLESPSDFLLTHQMTIEMLEIQCSVVFNKMTLQFLVNHYFLNSFFTNSHKLRSTSKTKPG